MVVVVDYQQADGDVKRDYLGSCHCIKGLVPLLGGAVVTDGSFVFNGLEGVGDS